MTISNSVVLNITNFMSEDGQIPAVDARELHSALEIGKDFSAWVKAQIERAFLVEGQDFQVIPQKGENSFLQRFGGRPKIDYLLSVDAAKHVCLMSQSEKGLAVRKYFIEVEKRYRQHPTAETPEQLMARAVLQAQQTIAYLTPKADAYDAIANGEGLYTIKEVADILHTGEKTLFRKLRELGYLSDHASYRNRPKKEYIDKGLFDCKATPYNTGFQTVTTYQPFLTPKGLTLLQELLKEINSDA